jgi:formate hydrogenlyase subunit 4
VAGVLAAAGVLLVLPGTLGRLPFDLPEAEQELMGGAMVEFGGRRLALLRWALFVRWLVVVWLIAEVFVPTPLPAPLAAVVSCLEALVLFTLAAAAGTLMTRLRVDHARAYLVQVGLLMGFAVVFALVGS